MGVDVSAYLFVGLKEDEIPEEAIERLIAKAKYYSEDGYVGNAKQDIEDSGLDAWLEENVDSVEGLSLDLTGLNDNAYNGGTATVIGFVIKSADSIEEVDSEEIIKGLQKASQEFESLFGIKPKMFLFPQWW